MADETFDKTIEELVATQRELEKNELEARKKIGAAYKELDKLGSAIIEQKKQLANIREDLKEAVASERISAEKAASYTPQLNEVRSSLTKLAAAVMPDTGNLFIRLFLGEVNVKHHREGERFRIKSEYEKFKRRTNPYFIAFAVLLLLFPGYRLLEILYQIWLLYYYVTLALRENILKVNGSNIAAWWTIHHYLSICMALTMLLWPEQQIRKFLAQFLYFCIAQGTLQILLNRYQQGRLYKLVLLGQASKMDVTGETEGHLEPRWVPSMKFLLPCILFVHCFQLYNAATLLRRYMAEPLEWQVLVVGLLFLCLGTGNIYTTLSTYVAKWKQARAERAAKVRVAENTNST